MKTLAGVIAAVALVLLIIGLTVKSLGFLVGVTPVLLVVSVLVLLMRQYGGRRIPR